MATPTKGDFGNTFLHFFINNSQRYIGLPGIYHTKIDNGIFDAIRDRVTSSDIPAAEVGETDCRLYGVEIVDGKILAEKLDSVINNQTMQSMVNQETYRTTDMIGFIDYNIGTVNTRLAKLIETVDALAAKLDAAVKTTPQA